MPLLGKIEEGTIEQLLQSAIQSQQDAVLILDASDDRATIHIEDGQVTRIDHQHANVAPTLQTLQKWSQGRFLLCHAHTPEARAASVHYNADIWLLDDDEKRRDAVHRALEEAGYSVCLLLDSSQATSLLHNNPPSVVLLGEHLAQTDEALLATLEKATEDELHLVLLGQQDVPPPALHAHSKNWFQHPAQLDALVETIRQLLRKAPGMHIQAMDPAWLHILSELTPPLRPNMRVQINPARWQELLQKEIPPQWREWLRSLDSRQPLVRWLKNYPGDQRHARLSMNILLQIGLIELQGQPQGELSDPNAISPNPAMAANAQKGSFAWLKVVVLGLRGDRREEYIHSLQQISQTQASRIPREPTVQIPYLPKTEYARIPLRQDSLLVVYGAISETSVDTIFERVGIDLSSFLFFVDMENPDEVAHIRDIRHRLLARYNIPDLIMVADSPNLQSSQVREQLRLSPQTPIEPVRQLELKSTYKILRKLLLKSVVSPT
ncbi:MAG: DUF4388 domain-containing protein [Myxococcales bacterium]|nr:DUF4388 domain-containing protein [Myxococcales bacterium]MCB9642926.1 DUF4388 domain-containing protein [Myxococcales bacterium]